MSYKIKLIKMAVKWTPKKMVAWVANIVLKGIAELNDYSVDLDARQAYVKLTLMGEAEPIEVWVNGFSVASEAGTYTFLLEEAKSNRIWLDNILAKIVGRPWNIPVVPQLAAHMELIADLLKAEQKEKQELPEATPEPTESV